MKSLLGFIRNHYNINLSKNKDFSPQVVKHVVKGDKWACSTPKAGKNKPIIFVAKTRDFKRFSEEIKENRRFG